MAVFFLQPIAFGSWLPRIPDIQTKLDLGPAELAMALLGMPIGILLTLPFAGRLVSKIGGRATILYGFGVFLALVSLPAFAPNVSTLFVALAVLGVAMSTLELGLNVEADHVEKATGAVIMSRCHGFWSLGIMAGSLVGAALAALHIPPHWAVLAVAVLVLPIALVTSLKLPAPVTSASADAEQSDKAPIKLPGKALLGICLFTFGITMTEGAIADWSAVYLRDMFHTEGMQTGIGYTIFAGMVAAGRFAGDAMRGRLGAVVTASVCGCFAVVGLAIVLLAPATVVALFGFGAVGLGVSVGFPLAVTASAALTDRPPAASVAILSFIALLGFLIGPPLIGFAAEFSDIRIGLTMLLPALFVSLLLTRMLAPRDSLSLLRADPQTR